jgi:hypothetical protein
MVEASAVLQYPGSLGGMITTYPQITSLISEAYGSAHHGRDFAVEHEDNPEYPRPHFLLKEGESSLGCDVSLKAKIENSGKALVIQMPDAKADIGAVHSKDVEEDKALQSPK